MEKPLENRRVRMTRQLLKESLLELLEHKELCRITVTEICENADVHRSTFYKYYEDPTALLREIEQDYLDIIPDSQETLDEKGKANLIQSTTSFFEYVKNNKKVFRILFNKSGDSHFITRLFDLLCSRYIIKTEDPAASQSRFECTYMACGSIGLMWDWIASDFPCSSREIAEAIFHLSTKIS